MNCSESGDRWQAREACGERCRRRRISGRLRWVEMRGEDLHALLLLALVRRAKLDEPATHA